jgi:hypothetical protein
MAVGTTSGDPAAMVMPAAFVNRFLISNVRGALVRLSFAEMATPTSPNYRAAVVMTAVDAKELALSILNLLGTPPAKPS